MKKTIVLMLILALGTASMTLAAEDTWTRKADMPTARGYLATAVVNGKIYVIGGAYGPTSGSSAVEEYDPATDIWTRKANMPETRSAFSTSVIDGKIYVIGGAESPYGALRSSIYVYDPATDIWTQKGQMLTPRVGLSAGVVDGKIYVIGGASAGVGAYFKTVEMYDPVTNNWTRKADMPTARSDHRASVVDGKIYVIGGTTSSSWTGLSVVEVYDPAKDIWTRKANMPTPRWGLGVGEVNGKIYAIGGASAPVWFSTVEQYNPSTNIWTTKTPMPTSRREFSVSVVDGKVYAIGGVSGNQGATYALVTVEEYDTGLSAYSPDFNGDGIVDSMDICILIEHWQTDYQLCDIAPPPFGDGIVNVQDLIMVAEHLFEEVLPVGLISYWKLDEAGGSIAEDTAGDTDGIVYGEAFWQTEGGVKGGALQLDGIDDYISADFVLNPADGPFSVFAWVNSSVPGGVVISQLDGIGGSGETWLGTEAVSDKLMTGLVPPQAGRDVPQPLVSESVITDGQWHHVGFVWDGLYRSLYVDGAEVAKDTAAQNPLKFATGGLYIGAGRNLEDGTFFAGLIDDVRIYNKALSAEEIASLAQ